MFGQAMAPGLERHRMADDLLNARLCGAGAQLGAQIDLVIAQQAQVQRVLAQLARVELGVRQVQAQSSSQV